MPIREQRFHGMVPKVDGEALGDGTAQLAKNCDITSGALRPINAVGPFVSMHNADGSLKSTLPVADLVTIPKPSTPTVIRREKICDPTQWLKMIPHEYVSYVDGTGDHIIEPFRGSEVPLDSYEHTETGMLLRYTLPLITHNLPADNTYFLRGPRYQFQFAADTANAYGGPDQAFNAPEVATYGDPEISAIAVPLIDEYQNVYATFEIADVAGPSFDEDYLVESDDPTALIDTYGEVTFRIDMNYTQSRRKHYYFVSSCIDNEEREGPPSEVSDDPVVIKPGERITLQTTRPAGASKMRLYRSGTGGDDFLLVDEYTNDEYTLRKTTVAPEEIEPFGNHPGTQADFITGAQIHPAHIGVAVYGDTLYLSDPYRLHAWPEEYTVPFTETVKAFALTGNTILVFAGENVYSIHGNNPKYMGKSLLSETAPLLNTKGLCRIGNTIFWPTHDGLAASSGGDIQIISKNHFTRQQWLEFNPELMEASTADNSIYLTMGSPVYPSVLASGIFALQSPLVQSGEPVENMRFDIEESSAAVSVYTALSGVSYSWHSKTYRFEQPTTFDAVKIGCDGSVSLTLYADGTEHGPFTITDDSPTTLDGLPHARIWEYKLEGSSQVRNITLYDRVVPTIDKSITLTPENTATWERFYVKYPDRGRFSGGILSCQGKLPVDIKFYVGDTLEHTQTVTDGHPFQLPRGLQRTDVWRIEIDTEQHINELTLFDTNHTPVQNEIVRMNDGFPVWFRERYHVPDESTFRSMKVMADAPVQMRVYLDGAIDPYATYSMEPGNEVRITDIPPCETLEFDFNGQDHAVRMVGIFLQKPFQMQNHFALQHSPVWRGNLLHFQDKGVLRVARVRGVGLENATLNLYRDGTLEESYSVTDGEVINFPRLADAQAWEIDLDAPNADVYDLLVVAEQESSTNFPQSPVYLQPVDIIKPWLYNRYNFPDREELTSLRVQATSYPVTMQLYLDDDTSPARDIRITNGYEQVLRGISHCQSIRFDFKGEDDLVREVFVHGRNVMPFPMGGYSVQSDAQPTRNRYMSFEDRNRPAVARIQASGYEGNNVTLRLRVNGQQVYNQTVSNNKPFLLPRGLTKDLLWEYDVQVNNEHRAEMIHLLPKNVVNLREREVNGGVIPPWMRSVYGLGGEKAVAGVKVHADEYPVTMNLYSDESIAPDRILVINDDSYVALEEYLSGNFLEYDFGGDDHKVNEVFVLQPRSIEVGNGAVNLTDDGVWGAYRFLFVDQGAFACGMVDAESYPVTLTLSVDGGADTTITVEDERPFRFPRVEGTVWEVFLSGTGTIHSAKLQPWVNRMVGDTIAAQYPESGFAPWLYTRWQAPADRRITAARVLSDQNVTMSLYENRSASVSESIDLTHGVAEVIPNGSKMSEIDFHFDGDDSAVESVWVHLEPEQLAMGHPMPIEGRASWRMMRFHFPDTGKIACVKVSSKDYANLYLTVYNDGTKVYSTKVRDDKPIALPRTLDTAHRWEVDLHGAEGSEVENILILPLRRELVQQNTIRIARRHSRVPEWYYTEYELPPNTTVRSALQTGKSGSMDIYDENGAKHRLFLRDGEEDAFSTAFEANIIQVDCGSDNDDIREAWVFLEDHVPVENSGVVLRHTRSHGWQNKVLAFSDTGSFCVGRVEATDFTGVQLTLKSDTDTITVNVSDNNEFKIPVKNDARQWTLQLENPAQVREVHLFTTDRRMVEGAGVHFMRPQEPHTWLDRRFFSPKPTSFAVARVIADEYPVRLQIRNGRDETVRMIQDDEPIRLPRVQPEKHWAFDVITDSVVHSVYIGTSMEGMRRG